MRDYLAEFRAAAAARGIDPERGSTAYQVALVKAEIAGRQRNVTEWWRRREMWYKPGAARSTTEERALQRVLLDCGLSAWDKQEVVEIAIGSRHGNSVNTLYRDVLREIYAEKRVAVAV